MDQEYPKYSVLMSLYIKEKPDFLRAALDSMLNQTVKPDEIVIVEDGPLTEALYGVLEEYKSSSNGIVKTVKNEKNLGLGLAMNVGLKSCRNEIVARMDTDDISVPSRCEKQLAVISKNPELSIVGAFVDEFYDDPHKIISTRKVPLDYENIFKFAKKRSPFNHPVVMYRKSKVLEIGGYSDMRRNQDIDLFGRMLFGGCIAVNIDQSLLLFRSNDNLAKRRKSWENTKSYVGTIKKFWRMGFSSFADFVVILIAQLGVFLMPPFLQHAVYKLFLRR